MNGKITTKISLIAPCGMNCSICRGYQREKNKCVGCREIDVNKPITRAKCKIKNCNELKNNNLKYCYKCINFPCTRLKTLDKRYRTKYNMSMIENLESIKENGMNKFLLQQEDQYKCQICGDVICVHNGRCYSCDPFA